ncbi:MAG TPA: ATP-grasp domain-containing protein [Candidatus Saccharimonadales bacterium]|nr:ATP-grasp domain-containing protein [Candidatus Saccharimonadales bacterium]
MHVLIIAPVHSGLLYIDSAHRLGASVSVITADKDDFAIEEGYKAKLDTCILVEGLHSETLIAAARALHRTQPISAVVAGVEFVVEETAAVAEALGLPGMRLEDASVVRDKSKMRGRLEDAGVRTVRYAKAGTATDLEQVADVVGFPAVIKPLSMAGSMGVVRVDDKLELLAAYEDICSDHVGWGDHIPGTEVLLEELLVGTEYCVDGYVTRDGAVHVFEFVKVELGLQPHFQEIGYTSYRAEDLDCASELRDYIISVARAMNITVGPFHSEVMLTKSGPVLIEIANRLPGDHLPQLTERATGISFADVVLASLLAIPIPAPSVPKARVAASQFIIDPRFAGEVYTRLEGWDEITKHDMVDDAHISIAAGEIISVQQDVRSRIAEIQFHAESVEVAEVFRAKIKETVRLVR